MADTDDGKDEEFKMTSDEMDRISKALKDEQFRDLLIEYANEISDPVNKKKYEDEIIAMEKQRGQEVKFLKPQAGFVMKTCRLSDNKKVFINICTSPNVQEYSTHVGKQNGSAGSHVSIPHSLTPGREDLDKAGKACIVYDVCFHPDAYEQAVQDDRFRSMLIETALDTLEKKTEKVDRTNKKFPKMKYKGTPQAAIIRENSEQQNFDMKNNNGKHDDNLTDGLKFPYPDTNEDNNKVDSTAKPGATNAQGVSTAPHEGQITPKYNIIHRGYFDMQNFMHSRENTSNIPKELVIEIQLPLAKSAVGIDLDIFEKQLLLDSKTPAYHLDISLPYKVKADDGRAQFDKAQKVLTVILYVQKPETLTTYATQKNLVQEVDDCETESTNSNELTNSSASYVNENREPLHGVNNEEHEDEVSTQDKDFSSTTTPASNLNEIIGADKEEITVSSSVDNSDMKEFEINEETFASIDFESLKFDTTLLESLPGNAKLPPYCYDQSQEKISIVVNVSNVKICNLSLGFTSQQVCLSFPQNPDDSLSPDWSMVVRLAEGNYLNKDECGFELYEDSFELILKKRDLGLWDKFFVGVSEVTLKAEFFITDAVAAEMFSELKKKSNPAQLSKEDHADITTIKLEGRLQQLLDHQDRDSKTNHYELLNQNNMVEQDNNDTGTADSEEVLRKGQDNCGLTEKNVQSSDVTSTTSDVSDEDDLDVNLNLLDLQDDVITDGSPLVSPSTHNKPEFHRSQSHDNSRSLRLRSILKRSKSDGASYDTDEDYSYTRTRAFTLSDSHFPSPNKKDFSRRRHKSVTFSEEPLVFEFTKLSKRQWKKLQKDEKHKKELDHKVSANKDLSGESDTQNTSKHENVKHGKKWKKKEKRRLRNNSESRSEEDIDTCHMDKKTRKKKKKNKLQNAHNPDSCSSGPDSSSNEQPKPSLTNALIFELE